MMMKKKQENKIEQTVGAVHTHTHTHTHTRIRCLMDRK